ncbi:MAG: membrane protein insertion efficiency factor YidD [Planctomycetota bacterium]|nr:membrane protein insertion efficiency factor YidD [Planctomycetota bacterium]
MHPLAWLKWVYRFPRQVLWLGVRFYQLAISPLIGRNCKFHPSCSNYMMQAVEKHGAVKGLLKGIWRIFRCHPWSQGGEDYP